MTIGTTYGTAMNNGDHTTIKEFKAAVNMSAKVLDSWLKTNESKDVGSGENEVQESNGHQSGQQIIEMLKKRPDDFNADNIKHARKVAGYIHRQLTQKPDGDAAKTIWRYTLMNWGHDPKNK